MEKRTNEISRGKIFGRERQTHNRRVARVRQRMRTRADLQLQDLVPFTLADRVHN